MNYVSALRSPEYYMQIWVNLNYLESTNNRNRIQNEFTKWLSYQAYSTIIY
jgi:hypothetical protein